MQLPTSHTSQKKKLPKGSTIFSPYLGPSFPEHEIEKELQNYAQEIRVKYFTNTSLLLSEVVRHLIHQKVIGWFQGRMEWGPRALGNRSILASARQVKMKDIMNARVKHRELFRPFAPVILEKYAKKYFQMDKHLSQSAKWMLLVYPFQKSMKKKIPAVVHVDGTGRLQTLARDDNPLYYDLLEKYYKKTGVPSIMNTSFNVRGEPIVCTPKDAIECFLKTDIDYVVIGRFLVSKRRLKKHV